MKWTKVGSWSFIVGLVIAILVAIFASNPVPAWAAIVLAILGVIVGLLNVTDEEASGFLIAAIAFLISFQALSVILTTLAFGWTAVSAFFGLLTIFVAPAAALVALKVLYDISKD